MCPSKENCLQPHLKTPGTNKKTKDLCLGEKCLYFAMKFILNSYLKKEMFIVNVARYLNIH